MDKIKVESFMKKFLLCVFTLGIIFCAGIIFTGCENLETVFIKDGVYNHEYTIGQEFDPRGIVLVEKTNKGYKEYSLGHCTYSLKGFSTAEVVEQATATIVYKNHNIDFKYSVALNSLGKINTSVNGAIRQGDTQNYYLNYDGNTHNISVDCVVEDVDVYAVYTNAFGQNVAFNGAKNEGTYKVTLTVSKEGYATQTIPVEIKINKRILTDEDIDICVYSYSSAHQQYEITQVIPKSNLDGNGLINLEYLYPGANTTGMYEIRAYAKNENGQYILTSDGSSILTLSGTRYATELGTQELSFNGFIAEDGISNYLYDSDMARNFSYKINKSSLSATLVTNDTANFHDKTVEYDGTLKALGANQEILINGEGAVVSYVYINNATGVETTDSLGVSDVGEYTVRVIYRFAHYVDVTLTATLTITEP